MNILQICNKAPYPPRDGHTIAMFNISKSLSQQGHSVKILSLNTKKHYVKHTELTKEFLDTFNPLYFDIDTSINVFSAIKNLLNRDSYNVSRFYSKDFEKIIADILLNNNFHIIQLETLFTTPYIDIIRKSSSAKIIFRPHNVEHIIWKRRAQNEKNPFLKKYINFLSKRLKTVEMEVINLCDGIAAISEIDKECFVRLGCSKPIINIPIGFDFPDIEPTPFEMQSKNLFYIGSFDWLPNVDGLFWFLDSVWKIVLEKIPDIQLIIAGRNIDKYIDKLNYQNLIIAGEVKDSRIFMQNHSIMIAPLRYGSGTRVKIIEAMACRKPIITTNVGSEGLNVTNRGNIIIEDNIQNFADSIVELINNPKLANYIASNAYNFAKEYFDNKKITNNLISFYNKILQN